MIIALASLPIATALDEGWDKIKRPLSEASSQGAMFLEPGATYPGIPSSFAYPAAFGDLLAALLALASIPAVAMGWKSARLLVWIFSVEGTLDLGTAIALAGISDAHVFMGPAYWIPAFWVPALLVTHYITFLILLKYGSPVGGPQARPDRAG